MARAIKAIQTRYKGHRFRSRLEARWAVYLDHLGIPWEYEKEGYVLLDGTPYLPDFWLPTQGAFLEVKGVSDSDSGLRAAMLATSSGHPVLIVEGSIGTHAAYQYSPKQLAEPEMAAWINGAPESIRALGWWGLPEEIVIPGRLMRESHAAWVRIGATTDYDADTGRLLIVECVPEINYHLVSDPQFGTRHEALHVVGFDYDAYSLANHWEPVGVEQRPYETSQAHQAAVMAARSARFEFGESGAG